MTDIVQRLRKRVPPTLNIQPADHVLFLEAADEIERLREENDRLRQTLMKYNGLGP